MWLDEINNNCNNPCLVLFGNKIDLDQKLREVTPEEIKKFCQEKNLSYFETSAKTKKGVKEGFSHIVNEAVDRIQALVPDNNNKNDNNIILENNDSSSSDKKYKKKKRKKKKSHPKKNKKKKNLKQNHP